MRARGGEKVVQVGYDPAKTSHEELLDIFWKAEDYHQDYYAANKTAGDCRVVISPNLRMLGLE